MVDLKKKVFEDEISRNVITVAEENIENILERSTDNVKYRVVDKSDGWLEAGYRLLQSEFDSSVLDPYERYVEWLQLNRQGQNPFPFLMMVAYLEEGNNAIVLGVVSGNLMRMEEYAGSNADYSSPPFIFAIGHQVTSKFLRGRGLPGLGSKLWKAALNRASKWTEELEGKLIYSVLESQTTSLGFWSKMGYRWAKGVTYWQPPLEFDSEGNFINPEVPEILMLLPLDGQSGDSIPQVLLKNIIATVYLNWSLHKYRTILETVAMERAENYVMKDLFGRVSKKMPDSDLIPLVPFENLGGRNTGRYRTIALNQGLQHGLQPLRQIRLEEINDFDALLRSMHDTAFGARALGNAFEVLTTMATDKKCKIVLTLSGAASIAKLDGIIGEMIDRDLIHCIVSTGAIICHGFNAERGNSHFKMPEGRSDTWLFEQGYDRIYDTVETEYALDELEEIVHQILNRIAPERTLCSAELTEALGRYLTEMNLEIGFLQSAYRKNVPIFIPAFTDSELGLNFATFNYYKREEGMPERQFNPFLDFERYCSFVRSAETLGIVTLGGGVPRNWAQQIGPYMDSIERRTSGIAAHPVRFKYAVRICPDPPYWGGLSGATYSEGVSWGKFVPKDEGGQYAEVLSDYTFVFPMLIKALFQRLAKQR